MNKIIAGVDEVGRGALAGPVYAAVVVFSSDLTEGLIRDSKKLSEKARESEFQVIMQKSIAWNIASASTNEIEEYNILGATMLAMRRAITGLVVVPDEVYVDGIHAPGSGYLERTVKGGDGTIASIAAASVLAKVTRDRVMRALSPSAPEYDFQQNKGYPSLKHRQALEQFGASGYHRRLFRPVAKVLR